MRVGTLLLVAVLGMMACGTQSVLNAGDDAETPRPSLPLDVGIAPQPLTAQNEPRSAALSVWVHNTHDRPVEFLLWNTPFESPLSADVFDVSHGGVALRYLGRFVKRSAPPPRSAWLTLAPGQRYEASVDITAAYGLQPGERYRVLLAPTRFGNEWRFNESASVENRSGPVALSIPH